MFRLGFDDDSLLKLGGGNSSNWELEYHQYVFQSVTKALQEHLFFLFFFTSLSPPNVPRRRETSKHSEPVSPMSDGA